MQGSRAWLSLGLPRSSLPSPPSGSPRRPLADRLLGLYSGWGSSCQTPRGELGTLMGGPAALAGHPPGGRLLRLGQLWCPSERGQSHRRGTHSRAQHRSILFFSVLCIYKDPCTCHQSLLHCCFWTQLASCVLWGVHKLE